jgi:hypothetical protein
MKRLLVVMLLMVSGSAFAESSLFEKMQMCTFYATKVTELTVYAKALNVDQIKTFEIIVQENVDNVTSPSVKQSIAFLGDIAWRNREQSPVDVGMAVYANCFEKTGTKT